MSFYREFKRRKVFRVAVVYAATAFAVVEAADLMLPRMGVPDWAASLVVALAGLGLPIALVLAWALELTPDGVRVTPGATVHSGESPPPLLGRRTVLVAAGPTERRAGVRPGPHPRLRRPPVRGRHRSGPVRPMPRLSTASEGR